MADKGFNIQDITATKDVHINLPTFFNKKVCNRFSPETIASDRQISSKRVHIERIISMFKIYKILKGPLNARETNMASQIIFVVSMLVNFRNSIMSNKA